MHDVANEYMFERLRGSNMPRHTKRMNYQFAVFIGLSVSLVHAHGPQIQIGIDNDKLVTRSLILDEPYNENLTQLRRVFEIPLFERTLDDSNDGWYSQPNSEYPFSGPGIATALGGFATDSIISLTFTDGLKIWDGATFIDPGNEQIDAYRNVMHIGFAITSDTGPFDSFNFPSIANSEDEHKYAFFRLLGDGMSPNTPSDDGVYLLSLRLFTNQPGVSPSDPYYFLFNKNASASKAEAALDYVNMHLVPEPATLSALGPIVVMLFGRRRHSIRLER